MAAIGGLGFWLPCIAAVWSHDGRLGVELFVGLICPLFVGISWYLARRQWPSLAHIALRMLAGVWILLPFGFFVAVAPTLSKVSIAEGFDIAIFFIPKFMDSPIRWFYRLGIHWGVIIVTGSLLGAAFFEKSKLEGV